MLKDTDLFGSTYYLQRDKIDDIYGKTVGEVVKKIISQEKVTSGRSVKSKVSLGNIVNLLGLGAEIGGSLNNENAMSREVIKELPYENKLLIALNAMEKEGKCCDFNESLGQHKNPKKHIYFKGEGNFSLRKENPEQFLVTGKVEDYEFRSFCSKGYIFSESLRDFLLDLSNGEDTLPIFCAGYIMHQREKSLDLTLYYIGGP
jgi:hypothetical protein